MTGTAELLSTYHNSYDGFPDFDCVWLNKLLSGNSFQRPQQKTDRSSWKSIEEEVQSIDSRRKSLWNTT